MKCVFGDMVEFFSRDKVHNTDLRWTVKASFGYSVIRRDGSLEPLWNLTPDDGIRISGGGGLIPVCRFAVDPGKMSSNNFSHLRQ